MKPLLHILKCAEVSSDMIERRDFARQRYGDLYDSVIADPKRIVLGVAKDRGLTTLQACMWICKRAILDGHGSACNLVIAATVDLIEAGNP